MTLVHLEYWNGSAWETGHHKVKLKDPPAYLQKLKKLRGIFARATDLDTGEEMYGPGGELL